MPTRSKLFTTWLLLHLVNHCIFVSLLSSIFIRRGAVGLFRVTEMTYTKDSETNATTRNVHMSFWNADGSAILIHNLDGKALERINVPPTVVEIETGAFSDCVRLYFVKLNEGLRIIRDGAFASCRALRWLPIPSTVRIIGNGAFGRCTDLESMRLPLELEQLGGKPFETISR